MTSQADSFNYTTFFEGLATRIATLKELRKAYDKEMAFDFIATKIFGPNENKFSEIIAFFLDPQETHGQGSTFLRIFCEMFIEKQSWVDWLKDNVVVRTEHVTDWYDENNQRRIDITIAFGDKFIVGIEDKIWADDQPKQINDYCTALEEWANGKSSHCKAIPTGSDLGRQPNYLCLYLTPYGDDPSEESIRKDCREELVKRGLLRCISYVNDIAILLERFAAACRAHTVEVFIRDFQKYIQHRFTGVKDMAIEKSIVDYLTDTNNPNYLAAAIQIHANITAVQDRLWKDTRGKIQEIMTAAGIICEIQEQWCVGSKEHVLIKIKFNNWIWGLFFDSARGSAFGRYMEYPKDVSNMAINNLQSELSLPNSDPAIFSIIGDTPKSKYLDWCNSDQPWLDMAETETGTNQSKFIKNILEWYEKDRDVVERFLKGHGIPTE